MLGRRLRSARNVCKYGCCNLHAGPNTRTVKMERGRDAKVWKREAAQGEGWPSLKALGDCTHCV